MHSEEDEGEEEGEAVGAERVDRRSFGDGDAVERAVVARFGGHGELEGERESSLERGEERAVEASCSSQSE